MATSWSLQNYQWFEGQPVAKQEKREGSVSAERMPKTQRVKTFIPWKKMLPAAGEVATMSFDSRLHTIY